MNDFRTLLAREEQVRRASPWSLVDDSPDSRPPCVPASRG